MMWITLWITLGMVACDGPGDASDSGTDTEQTDSDPQVVDSVVEEPEELTQLVVNEVNATTDQIELFNNGAETIDLFEYEITDHADEDVLAWRLPAVSIAPGEYLVIEADGTGDGLHTDFNLSAGETVTLWTSEGRFADALEVEDTDGSWARVPDGWTSKKEQDATFGATNGG